MKHADGPLVRRLNFITHQKGRFHGVASGGLGHGVMTHDTPQAQLYTQYPTLRVPVPGMIPYEYKTTHGTDHDLDHLSRHLDNLDRMFAFMRSVQELYHIGSAGQHVRENREP